ncbi:hypothetical protein [Ochrovirga pacifica]|uniref:hypothetical protein n=1 Tax=Ochrovirga pacifica TaxID=1042376 RepID=UPI0002559809|nr:hypothetical protein [Ochrovirga pacifica]
MNAKLEKTYREKTTEELELIVADSKTYVEKARQVAVALLEERKQAAEELLAHQQKAAKQNPVLVANSVGLQDSEDEVSVFEELDAPTLYSVSAIVGFSFFFSSIHGSFLMASNFRKLHQPKMAKRVLLFGFLYVLICIVVDNLLNLSVWFDLIWNVLGSMVLISYFWNKHIGKEQMYEAKAVWSPLLISVAILVGISLLNYYYDFLIQLF